jgi:hypothetical protein
LKVLSASDISFLDQRICHSTRGLSHEFCSSLATIILRFMPVSESFHFFYYLGPESAIR